MFVRTCHIHVRLETDTIGSTLSASPLVPVGYTHLLPSHVIWLMFDHIASCSVGVSSFMSCSSENRVDISGLTQCAIGLQCKRGTNGQGWTSIKWCSFAHPLVSGLYSVCVCVPSGSLQDYRGVTPPPPPDSLELHQHEYYLHHLHRHRILGRFVSFGVLRSRTWDVLALQPGIHANKRHQRAITHLLNRFNPIR